MPTTVVERCDFCNKILVNEGKRIANKHGFVCELGYSAGGWGNRKDFMPKTSVEICDECFICVKQKAHEIKELIYKLKNQPTTTTKQRD